MTLHATTVDSAKAVFGKTSASLDQSNIIATAMAWPMDHIIKRYMSDYNLTQDVAKDHEREIKRFLLICALKPRAKLGFFGPVDELWHCFMLFSEDYFQFCEAVAGKYIHHRPETASEPQGETIDGYATMLAEYESLFGEPPPPHLWPRGVLEAKRGGGGRGRGCGRGGCGAGGNCSHCGCGKGCSLHIES